MELPEFKSSDYLNSPAAISAYLTDALEVGQADFLAKAMATAIEALDRLATPLSYNQALGRSKSP